MYLYIFQYFNPNAVYWLRISRNVSMTFEARCSGVPWLRKHAATWSPWRIWWVWSFLESQASCASENNNFEDTMIYFSEYIDRYIDRYIHNRYIYTQCGVLFAEFFRQSNLDQSGYRLVGSLPGDPAQVLYQLGIDVAQSLLAAESWVMSHDVESL